MIRWMLVFAVAHLAAVALVYGDETPPTDGISETAKVLHEANQGYRISRGLARQDLDADLCSLCQRHAEWMASRGSMFHGSGENIVAYGTPTVTSTMAMWRGSGPHNGFLLSSATRAGWGHAVSAGGVHFWSGAFRGAARPKESADVSPETNVQRPGRFGWLFGRRR